MGLFSKPLSQMSNAEFDEEFKALPSWKRHCIGATSFILILFILWGGYQILSSSSSDESNKYTLEQQQTAFNNWYFTTEQKIKFFDGTARAWQSIFDQLSAGEIDRGTAYSKLKHLGGLLANNSHDFYKITAPKELSEKHQKLLEDAASKMSTAAGMRKDAAEHAMEWLDDPKPSKQQKVLDDLQSGQKFAMDAAALFVQVRTELQIPAPADSAQK